MMNLAAWSLSSTILIWVPELCLISLIFTPLLPATIIIIHAIIISSIHNYSTWWHHCTHMHEVTHLWWIPQSDWAQWSPLLSSLMLWRHMVSRSSGCGGLNRMTKWKSKNGGGNCNTYVNNNSKYKNDIITTTKKQQYKWEEGRYVFFCWERRPVVWRVWGHQSRCCVFVSVRCLWMDK